MQRYKELEHWNGIEWEDFHGAWSVCGSCPGRNVVPRHLQASEHKHVGSVAEGKRVKPRLDLSFKERLLDAQGLPWVEFLENYRVCKYCRSIRPIRFPKHWCGEYDDHEAAQPIPLSQ